MSPGCRFQHGAGDLDQLGAHLARRDQRGAAGNHQRPAGKGAPAIRRAIGVAVDDLDQVGRDAELVGDDLRQRRAQALAVRRGADAGLDEAGRVDGENHGFPAGRDRHAARGKGGTAVAGALGEGRKADAEMAASGARLFLPLAERRHVDGFDRHFQRLFIAGLVVNQARGGGVGECVDQVAAADVDRVDGESGRCLVHQPFQRERDDGARHAAIGAPWCRCW